MPFGPRVDVYGSMHEMIQLCVGRGVDREIRGTGSEGDQRPWRGHLWMV